LYRCAGRAGELFGRRSATSSTSRNRARDFQLEIISQILVCFDTNPILNLQNMLEHFEHFATESFDLGASVPHYPRLGLHFTAGFTKLHASVRQDHKKSGAELLLTKVNSESASLNLSCSKTPLVCVSTYQCRISTPNALGKLRMLQDSLFRTSSGRVGRASSRHDIAGH
jgi:hypothetical protein